MTNEHPPVDFDVIIDHSGGVSAEYPCEAERKVKATLGRMDGGPSEVTRAALDAIRGALRIVTEGAQQASPLLIGWDEAAYLLGLCVPRSDETSEHATARGVRAPKRRFERGQVPEEWVCRPKRTKKGAPTRGGNRGRIMFWRARLLADGGAR